MSFCNRTKGTSHCDNCNLLPGFRLSRKGLNFSCKWLLSQLLSLHSHSIHAASLPSIVVRLKRLLAHVYIYSYILVYIYIIIYMYNDILYYILLYVYISLSAHMHMQEKMSKKCCVAYWCLSLTVGHVPSISHLCVRLYLFLYYLLFNLEGNLATSTAAALASAPISNVSSGL